MLRNNYYSEITQFTVGLPQLERLDETTTEMATARDHRLHVMSATGRIATAGRLTMAGIESVEHTEGGCWLRK